MSTIASDIAVGKDLVVALAAIVTATVAVIGVKKWRDELRGRAHFDTARSLILATYKLRDELRNCRAPLVRAAEFPQNYAPEAANHRAEAEAWAHVYNSRFTSVREALQEFDTQGLEAEALWGSEVRDAIDRLRVCVRTLWAAMEAMIDDKMSGGENFRHDQNFGRKMRAEVAASSTAADNPLSNEIAAAVSDLEAKLRVHLER